MDLEYQAKSWNKPRRIVAKIEWHLVEPPQWYSFIVINSKIQAGKVVKVNSGRVDVENRRTGSHRGTAASRLEKGF